MAYIIYTDRNYLHSIVNSNKNCKEIKKNTYNQKNCILFKILEEMSQYCKNKYSDNRNKVIYCAYNIK